MAKQVSATEGTKHSAVRFKDIDFNKLRYIAHHDTRTFTGVLNLAFAAYIKAFEQQHGPITQDLIDALPAPKKMTKK